MATWKSMLLLDSSSFLLEQLSFFHDHASLVLSLITCLVGYLMGSLLFNNMNHRYLLEGQDIEIIWTLLPAIMLIFIALPFLKLVYLIDEIRNPLITLKTIGHQWYWSYEYTDFNDVEFDSYMLSNSLNKFNFRLLEVDNHTIIPYEAPIRLLTTQKTKYNNKINWKW